MNPESDYIRIVFGLKLRQQRQKKNWSLNDLATQTGLSKSYLNEIENGKKFPKHDKIVQLSEIFNCTYDDLVSTKLDKSLAPFGELLQSDFLKKYLWSYLGLIKIHSLISSAKLPKR